MVPKKELSFGQSKACSAPLSCGTWVLCSALLALLAWMPMCFANPHATEKTDASCTVGPTISDRGPVSVKSGEAFSVCLSLVPGAGQIWRVKVDEDAKTFQAMAEPTFETPIEQPGAEGYMRFVLRPLSIGTFNLVFQKFGPGRSARELATVSLTFTVS